MRIAIPLSGNKLSSHFGHSEHFLFVDADVDRRTVLQKQLEKAPDHAPGVLPAWLADHQVDVVIAAGLGARARDLLAARSVQVLTGVSDSDPETLVTEFFNGSLRVGADTCNHSHHNCEH